MTTAYDEIKPLYETLKIAKGILGSASFFSGVIGCFNTCVFL